MTRQRFAGKVALVTGAASGIGQGLVLALAREGAALVLCDIDGARLGQVAAEAGREGQAVQSLVRDVSRPDHVEDLARSALGEFGRVDLLVNNAGVAVAAPVTAMTAADWEWIMGVNLWGPIRLTQALLPSMIARRSGHIVNIASMAGLIGAPGMAAYSTTKFGLVGFSETLRLEVADQGIDLTLVCPGYVRTNLINATRYRNDGFEHFLRNVTELYGVPVERAAARIVDAIAGRVPRLMIGPEQFGWLLKRISPEALHQVTRLLARHLGVLGGAST